MSEHDQSGIPGKRSGGVAERVIGGSPARTLIQLLIASIVVGAIFSFLGLGAFDFWNGIFDTITGIVSTLGESIGEVARTLITYLFVGAVIVIPIWIVMRLMRGR